MEHTSLRGLGGLSADRGWILGGEFLFGHRGHPGVPSVTHGGMIEPKCRLREVIYVVLNEADILHGTR